MMFPAFLVPNVFGIRIERPIPLTRVILGGQKKLLIKLAQPVLKIYIFY